MMKKILAAILVAMVFLVGCGAEEIPVSIEPIQPKPIESQTKETSEDQVSEETKVTEVHTEPEQVNAILADDIELRKNNINVRL